ncbi:MAG: hypothetical protein R3B82_23510 [Sandaracinaceae bacterium]
MTAIKGPRAASARIAPHLAEFFNLHLLEFVSRYRRVQELPEYLTGPARELVQQRLEREMQENRLGPTHVEQGACMIHVPFERRYGRNRAACLNGHGDWHRPGDAGGH